MRIGELFKTLGQELGFTDALSRFVTKVTSFGQGFVWGDSLFRIPTKVFNLGQLIDFGYSVFRIGELFKTMSQSFVWGDSTIRVAEFFKLPTQLFTWGDLLFSFPTRVTSLGQEFTSGSAIKNLYSYMRFPTQQIQFSSLVQRIQSLHVFLSQFFTFTFWHGEGQTHYYGSVQGTNPNITANGNYDVNFTRSVEITSSGLFGWAGPISVTLPTGTDYWTVREGTGCSGSIVQTGSGTSVSWKGDTPLWLTTNETICYEYNNGVTASGISWHRTLQRSLTTRISFSTPHGLYRRMSARTSCSTITF